jgi:hypothetical protein
MSRQDDPQTHPNFDAPIEIVADHSLSKQEKAETRRWRIWSRTRGSWLSPPARE